MVARRLLIAAPGLVALALLAGPAPAAPTAEPGDMSLGDPRAPVKVVEYASASCSHCAHFNETVFPAFKAKYIDTGKVHYTLKEALTPPQAVAAAGFMLSRCAGPDRYFPVLDKVFRSQSRWTDGPAVRQALLDIAKAEGMSEPAFEACLSDDKAREALNGRVARIQGDDVQGTPTFFVNGRKVSGGTPTLEQLDAAIAAAGK